MVYAEIEGRTNTTELDVLIRVPNRSELEEFMWRFEMVAPACLRIRYLKHEDARKHYDLRRFGNPSYETRYVLNDNGRTWSYPAIMRNEFYESRRQSWRQGGGRRDG